MCQDITEASFEKLWQLDRCPYDVTQWNDTAASYNRHLERKGARETQERIRSLIIEKTGLESGAVLDIGCGSGQLSREFARLGHEVVGIDAAENMIHFARENSAPYPKASFAVINWREANLDSLGWKRKFELSLASRTPAVSDRETLAKMIAASHKSCCLLTMTRMSNSIRDLLHPIIDWDTEKAHRESALYCAFNILWLWGYYPEISYLDDHWEKESEIDEILPIYIRFFSRSKKLSDEQKKAMRQTLEAVAVNGKVLERVHTRIAFLTWDVHSQRNKNLI